MDLPATFDGRPGVTDTLGRAMRDLRISVTDRCNFRCTYCMPKEVFGRDYAFLPRDQVLSFEEIDARGARVRRARRREAADHRRRAARPARPAEPHRACWPRSAARTASGLDLTLTTNGSALRALARPLADAGPAAGDGQPRLARRRGLRRDERDRLPGRAGPRRDRRRDRGRASPRSRSTWSSGAASTSRASSRWPRWARETGVILRFIEYMDVGHSNGWRLDEVVPAEELIASDPRALADRAGRPGLPRRGRRPLALPRRRAASSGSSRRSPSRSAATARARGCRPTASSTRACSRSTAATSGPCCAAAPTDEALVAFLADIWSRRDDRYSELRSRGDDLVAAQGRDVRDGRLTAAGAVHAARPQLVHSPSQFVDTQTGAPARNSWITALTRPRAPALP